MLLEKAYAKLFGTYRNIVGGTIDNALRDLTGCHTCLIDIQNDMAEKSDLCTFTWNSLNQWYA